MICYYCTLESPSEKAPKLREPAYALDSSAPRCSAHWRVECGQCGSASHFMAAAYCPSGERFFCSGCAVESSQLGPAYGCWDYSFSYRSPWSGQWQPDLGVLAYEGRHPYQVALDSDAPFPFLAGSGAPRIGEFSSQRWTGGPDIDSAAIESAWDANAAAWDRAVDDDGDENRRYSGDEVLLGMLGEVAGKDVLDLGCGNGYLCRKLASAGASVTGVDPSAEMIKIAVRREAQAPLGAHYERIGATELAGFASGSFDLVVANHVLTAVTDLPEALAAINRVLRPGGRLVALISHPCFSCGPRDWLRPVPDSPRPEEASGFLVDHYFRTGAYYIENWPGFGSIPYVHRPLREYWRSFTSAGFHVVEFDEPGVGARGRDELVDRQVRQLERIPTSCVFALTRVRDAAAGSRPEMEAERA